jgi:hypothetical protein
MKLTKSCENFRELPQKRKCMRIFSRKLFTSNFHERSLQKVTNIRENFSKNENGCEVNAKIFAKTQIDAKIFQKQQSFVKK